jgi:hypothetical protein
MKGLALRKLCSTDYIPIPLGSKVIAQVKVFVSRSKSMVKVTRSKVLIPKAWCLNGDSLTQI